MPALQQYLSAHDNTPPTLLMPEIRPCSSLEQVQAQAWDALHDSCNPFVAHAFLAGLEAHGCLREDWGWRPQHLTLWEDDALIAAVPGYLKTNSHGEFVFDHAWAHTFAHYGRDYFPKYLCAVPYSPVTGPRLLAKNTTNQAALREAIVQHVRSAGLSSAHVNFHTPAEDTGFTDDWLHRIDVQYHWRNDAGWETFADFLGAMDHKHRKNIRQERTKVAKAGVHFRILHGDEANDDHLAAIYHCYLQTFAEYGNAPALTFEFLQYLAKAMPRQLVLILAERGTEPIAGALCLRGGDTLYGRYWGATAHLPGLHFETCYYQGIDYCLREGLKIFEPGAQGQHKMARGFLPTQVHSRHWIADPAFAKALRDWCAQEVASVQDDCTILAAHSPFRHIDSTGSA